MLSTLNGVFAVNKPVGAPSASVVGKLKRHILSGIKVSVRERARLSRKFKVGHGGTLDPLASGVLVIGIGEGCKRLGNFLKGPKSYRATAKFGVHYDTLDITGKLLFTDRNPPILSKQILEEACKKWTGDIMQKPPAYSALKINGKRAYEIARRTNLEVNEETENHVPPTNMEPIDMPARPVKVYAIEIEDISNDVVIFKMDVSGGTYVRSLIRDIAKELNTVAAMTDLLRTRQGMFSLSNALEIEDCDDLEKVKHAVERSNARLEESPQQEQQVSAEQAK